MSHYIDENPEYWEDYNNLQRVKHELLKRYLGGWFPILASWSGQVTYIDCHAGRGKHETGHAGSPLIALETLLSHAARAKILKNCEVRFSFIEANPENKKILENNLASYERLPNVVIKVECEDFQKVLQDLVDQLHAQGDELGPAFVFVDPYGFRLPGKLLAQLKAFKRCELFITFMWRWIDMAIHHPTQKENMDALFGTPDWHNLLAIEDASERCEAAIRLLGKQIGGEYLTRVKMLGEREEIKYVLIHTTGHPKGRDLMLDAIWKICPTGGFKARINDNPGQEYLIKPEPDLEPLKLWLWNRYRNKTTAVRQIYTDLRAPSTGTLFLQKHLHQVLIELHKNGGITGPEKLIFSKNPTISFRPKKTTHSEKE